MVDEMLRDRNLRPVPIPTTILARRAGHLSVEFELLILLG